MYQIAVLVSGAGSNFMSIAEAVEDGRLTGCRIACVISDNPKAAALERAAEWGIKTHVAARKEYKKGLSGKVLEILEEEGPIDLVVLAGFLSILRGTLLARYKNRIINIHPSLIPSFCGAGMYGLKVHQAALEYGVKVTGCTVHLVDEGTDTGGIILQKPVAVTTGDPVQLQRDVLEWEHKAIVEAVGLFAQGRVSVEGRQVRIQ